MYYKLYRERSRTSHPAGLDTFEEFNKIYTENGVKVIGVWQNQHNDREYFFMTAYRDEDHYNQFVHAVSGNARYQELSNILARDRESIEAISLIEMA